MSMLDATLGSISVMVLNELKKATVLPKLGHCPQEVQERCSEGRDVLN